MVVTTKHAMERKVGIRKLRDELTRHLGQVRRGARITVTDRGQPVALLLPYTKDSRSERAERLRALLSSEHIAPAEKQFLTHLPLVKGRGPLPSDLISEGRR
jgi:prevent-host-death family protein